MIARSIGAIALVAAAAMLTVSAARTDGDQPMTLLQLHSFCAEQDNTSCVAFFAGFIQGLNFGTANTKAGEPFCLPANMTTEQGILILNKIVRDGPQFANLAAVPALAIAFQKSFPCPK